MRSLMKIACGGLIVAVLAGFTSLQQSNFSGTWKLNTQKSELGEFGEMMTETKITVEEQSDRIQLTRTGKGEDGTEKTSRETYSLDGKTSSSETWDEGKKIASLKKTGDGKSFVISFSSLYKWEGENWTLKGTETWQLSNDGKSLVITLSGTSPDFDMHTKGVYEKQ